MHIQTSGSGTFALIDSLQLGFNVVDSKESVSGSTSISAIEPISISGAAPIQIIPPIAVSGPTSIEVTSGIITGPTSIQIVSGTPQIVVSGTGTFIVGNFYANLSGTVVVQNAGQSSISGTLSVTTPNELPGSITTTAPIDLAGSVSVIGVTDADLSGTLVTSYDYNKYLPGKLSVTNPTDLPGYIVTSTTGTSYLPGILAVQLVSDLSGTITTVAPSYLSGSLTTVVPSYLPGYIKTTQPSYLDGEIDVIRPFDDISGSLTTTQPSYLDGWIDVIARYESSLSGTLTVVPATEFSYLSGTVTVLYPGVSNLSGTISTSRDDSVSLPGEIEVIDRISEFLSGTLQVQPYSDFPGTITTVRPSASIPGRVKVGDREFEEISGSIIVWKPADLSGQLQVVRPSEKISGSITLVPYADLSGTLTTEVPSETLSGTLTVGYFDSSIISGSITTDKHYEYLSGTLDVRGKSVDLNGYIVVDLYTSSYTLPGVIMVTWGNQNRDLPGKIEIFPYVDLSGSMLVERPYFDLPGTITVIPRFDNNVGIDVVYAQDNYSLSILALTAESGTAGPDVIEISQSDEFTWEWLPHLRVTGTDVIDIGQNDSFETFMYGEETTEWSYPIQLTDNVMSGNDYNLPTITEFDGKAFVSYNHNFNGELFRTIVVKTQEGGKRPNEKWIVSNIYNNVTDGQFVGPDAQMIHEQVHGFVLHPGPQADNSNDFFDTEIVFTPESYDVEGAMYRDLWETVQYQMQKQGEIFYPPTQWGFNPLTEIINGPTDIFDPIPKPGNFTPPTNGDGYYQDFGNFFTGNG